MGQSITITEKAYEILKRVKKEVKARDGECTLSGAVVELDRISNGQISIPECMRCHGFEKPMLKDKMEGW